MVVSKGKCNNGIKRENSTIDLGNNQQGIPYIAGPKWESMPSLRYKTKNLGVCRIKLIKSTKIFFASEIFLKR